MLISMHQENNHKARAARCLKFWSNPSSTSILCVCEKQRLWRDYTYSKTCVKRPLSKRPKNGVQDQLSLNAGQKYCRMLQGVQGEHSAILSTCIKLPFIIKIFVLSMFEWPFYTGFTVFAGLSLMLGQIYFLRCVNM